MDVKEYEELSKFLTEGIYPEGTQLSSQKLWNFKRRAKNYTLSDSGILYKKMSEDDHVKLEVPICENLPQIFEKFHDLIGHPGINSTIQGIQSRYTWRGMYPDISNYVKTCVTCQQTAALPAQPQRKLQPIPPPDGPWKHIGMDLCDFPETPDGYKHILVTVCYLSKYVVARALKSKTTDEVIRELQDIYLELGLPDIIQHDQGKEFTSKAFQGFHGKENKQEECDGDTEWTDKLQPAVPAANTQTKKSTSYTPFTLCLEEI